MVSPTFSAGCLKKNIPAPAVKVFSVAALVIQMKTGELKYWSISYFHMLIHQQSITSNLMPHPTLTASQTNFNITVNCFAGLRARDDKPAWKPPTASSGLTFVCGALWSSRPQGFPRSHSWFLLAWGYLFLISQHSSVYMALLLT